MSSTNMQGNVVYNNYTDTISALERKPLYEFVKRVFDIVFSLFALIFLSIPIAVISIIIKIDSPGGVVYKQERLGKDGVKFTLYKFRTMRLDAEKDGAKWADENDDRITKAGYWLRLFRLDEILQFVNVLKGDMTLIGPRPEREMFHKEFRETIPDWDNRLLVKQGITGLAQVCGGYSLKPEEKIIYDIEYINNRSIWLDIKILFKTIGIVFSHEGAR